MAFSAIILVCSVVLTPLLGDCTPDNAVTTLRVPGMEIHPAICMMHAQAYLANSEIGRTLTEQERIKIVCVGSRRDRP